MTKFKIPIILLSVFFITVSNTKNKNLQEDVKIIFPNYIPHECINDNKARITIFCINENDSYLSIGTKPSKYEYKLLDTFLHVFPRKIRERVVEVEFEYKDEFAGAAAATGIDTDNSLWTLWINTNKEASGDITEILKTITHELMHYLTLNITQTTVYADECLGMEKVFANCPKKNTLLYGFIQKFWVPIYDKRIWPKGDYNRYYDEHSDDFVTPYAVTDPAEDIAETFIEFIFNDKPKDSSLIKNQKILYFWKFDEYISLRKEIKKKLNK